jgi:hypothetical protein
MATTAIPPQEESKPTPSATIFRRPSSTEGFWG